MGSGEATMVGSVYVMPYRESVEELTRGHYWAPPLASLAPSG
jgi:hypothetical protein